MGTFHKKGTFVERAIVEKITLKGGVIGNVSLNKFRKIAYIEWFFRFFRHFIQNYAIKTSTFTKLGEMLLKYGNFSKFSVSAAPKM